MFWFQLWQDSGRPSNGALHQVKTPTQLKYKLAIRQVCVDFENSYLDDVHMHFMHNNF